MPRMLADARRGERNRTLMRSWDCSLWQTIAAAEVCAARSYTHQWRYPGSSEPALSIVDKLNETKPLQERQGFRLQTLDMIAEESLVEKKLLFVQPVRTIESSSVVEVLLGE